MASIGFYIFLLYNLSYFLRFAYRFPICSIIHFDQILVICALGCWLFAQSGNNRFLNDISRRFKFLIMYIILSFPLVKWPGSIIYYGFEFYLKAIIFFLFFVAFIDTEKKLKVFVFVFLGCQIFRIIEPGYLHITEGYWGSDAYSMVGGELSALDRLSSAPADVLNPTQFGGLIVTIIPFLYFLFWKSQKIILKSIFLCLTPFCLYVLLLTGARSGLICLLVVIFTITYFDSGKTIKLKKIFLSVAIIIPLLFFSLTLLPSDMQERYFSLVDSSAKGHDTVSGRMKGLATGFNNLFVINNILGHGLGTSAEANYHISGYHIRSHSFYIETIQEVGIIGLILFLKYIQSIFIHLALIRRRVDVKKHQWYINIVKSLQAWAAMYLVYCIICFGLSSWEWYLFGGMAAACLNFSFQFNFEDNDPAEIINN
ncbi:MAG: O-antigen ligase family protein [Proteobacteria bacterium]|nr:O-antigen ligase family protein [Pseudomonadota bacterium]